MPLTTASSMFVTLEFPEHQPVPDDRPLSALPPAAAPVLMPAPPPAPEPPEPQQENGADGNRRAKITAAATAACLVVIALVVTLLVSGHDSPGGGAAAGNGSGGYTTDSSSPEESTTESTSATVDSEDAARQQLEAQAASDRSAVESLTNSWVPQLSSKKPGLVVNGTTYDYQAIWADFTALRERYPGALLLWSGDYSSFRYGDYWVTVAGQSYGDGTSANYWCDSEGIGKDDCFAKRITHSGGYTDSTLHRN